MRRGSSARGNPGAGGPRTSAASSARNRSVRRLWRVSAANPQNSLSPGRRHHRYRYLRLTFCHPLRPPHFAQRAVPLLPMSTTNHPLATYRSMTASLPAPQDPSAQPPFGQPAPDSRPGMCALLINLTRRCGLRNSSVLPVAMTECRRRSRHCERTVERGIARRGGEVRSGGPGVADCLS